MNAKRARKESAPPERANASPSKDIFVDMLTRDLALTDAISDLIDNSVDGARRTKKRGESNDGYEIDIRFDGEKFCISDNCGGIATDVAKEYAFCFGRPVGREPEKGLIGEFGVGMKRAIFKIGKHFVIDSKTTTSHFVMDVDVNKWRLKKEWNFPFEVFNGNTRNSRTKVGTTLTVTKLREEIASAFKSDHFKENLRGIIQAAHREAISAGLSITICDQMLVKKEIHLKQSPKIKPGYLSK
jgi:hypothetical protein